MTREQVNMKLTERQLLALQMRRDGKKLHEIGGALGISTTRARQLIERAQFIESQSEWAEGLPSRYVTALVSRGITSRAAVETAVADGSLARLPGVGKECYSTIIAWLNQ
jgi:hypothetical protein